MDCSNNKVIIEVQIKATDIAHSFLMGDANLYFDYDPRVIRNPSLISQDNFSNQAPANDAAYTSQVLNNTLISANTSILSLNIRYGGLGFNAKRVNTSWLTVASIRFDIQNPSQCISLIWHNSNRSPITVITEIELSSPTPDGNYYQYILTEGGAFENINACIPTICSGVTAQNDTNITKINTTVHGSAALNDVSQGGGMLFTPIGVGTNGTWSLQTDGNYSYTPIMGFLGSAMLSYQVCNIAGQCDTATIYMTVYPSPNKPPTVTKTAKTVLEDTPTLLCTPFIDPDVSDSHTVILCGTKGGNVVLNPIQNKLICFNYTSLPNFNGQDTVCLILCDAEGLCDTAQILINVMPVADPPILADVLPLNMAEDSTITVCSTIDDVDTPFGPFTFSVCRATLGSTLTPSVNGNEWCLTYTPAPNFVGFDTLCLIVCDQTGLCATLQKIVAITPKPDPPTVTAHPKTTLEDTPLALCQTITDTDGDTFFYARLAQQPLHGSTSPPSVNNHQVCVTYMPEANYNGLDSFFIIVCDSKGLCDTAKNLITIEPVNDKPNAMATPIFVSEDSTVRICVTATDLDTGSTFVGFVATYPQHGSSSTPSVGESQICLFYMPSANYYGFDTIAIAVCDESGLCDTVKIKITIMPQNDPPVLTNYSKTTSEGTLVRICQTISDLDLGDTFSARLYKQSFYGITSPPSVLYPQVCLDYTPMAYFNGMDTVWLVVCDNSGACDTAKILINITPIHQKPLIHVAPVTVLEDGLVSICPTFTDADIGTVFTTHICRPPNHGVVGGGVAVNDNQICLSYTPTLNYNGQDTLCFVVCDQTNLCDTAQIPITVTQRPDAPDVFIAPIITLEDVTKQVCYTIIDPDEGDSFTASLCYEPANGAASTPIVRDHQFCFDYAPHINFFGQDTVCLTICDQAGLCKRIKIPIIVTPVPDKPMVENTLPIIILEDTYFNTCLNIFDPDTPEGLFSVQICQPLMGTLSQSFNGELRTGNNMCFDYMTKPNYFGRDTICLSVCDVSGLCDTFKKIITITAVNDKPFVRDSLVRTTTAQTVTTCLPIIDPDVADTYLAFSCANVRNGQVSAQVLNRNLCVTYIPSMRYVGKDSVCYILCDNGVPLACDTVKVFFEVITTNLQPIANNDINTALAGKPTKGNVLTNDSDLNVGQIGTASAIKMPKYAAAFTFNPNGSYTYTSAFNFVGSDTLTYKICDDGVPVLCDTAVLCIKIRPILPIGNQRPMAQNDYATTPSGQPITLNVKANDTDPNQRDVLGLPVVLSSPACGTAVVNVDGTLTFSPNPVFTGECSLLYAVCDTGMSRLCDTAMVNLVVYPNPFINNKSPIAISDGVATTINTPIAKSVATNDSDPDRGQTLSFVPFLMPQKGTVQMQTNGDFTYMPNMGFVGKDSFSYIVCDNTELLGQRLCDTAWVFVLVSNPIFVPNNLPPVANPDNPATTAGIATTFLVKANDFDPNGDPLPMLIGQSKNLKITVPPTCGTATVNANESIYFVPNTGFTGFCTFIYQICDNQTPSLCDTALVTIKVNPVPTPPNRPPVALNDAFVAVANDPLSNVSMAANDSDPNSGQILNFTQLTTPTRGLLFFDGLNGRFTFLPAANFIGLDSFRYTVCDNGAPVLCDTAWVYISYKNVPTGNVSPLAADDATKTLMNTPITIAVLSNDNDLNNDPLSNPTVWRPPTCGTASVNANGTIQFVPTIDFVGKCTFFYTICDAYLCDTAAVSVEVLSAPAADNQPPIAQNDATVTRINQAVNGDVSTNDKDPDRGQSLVFYIITEPLHGKINLKPNGQYIYAPNLNFLGQDTFRYKTCDNGTPTLCTTVFGAINVVATNVNINEPPQAFDDKISTSTGLLITIPVKANDYDLNKTQTLGFPQLTETPRYGTAFVNSDGTIDFQSNNNFTGICELNYRVCDDGSPMLCDTARVEITVNALSTLNKVSVAPVAVDDANANYKNALQRGYVGNNDNDANSGQAMTYQLLNEPENGFILLQPNGAYTYRPDSNYVGTDNFTYQVCDTPEGFGAKLCDTATAYLTIFEAPCVSFNLKVLLEGCYKTSTGLMQTNLNQRGLLPGQTPIGEYAVKTKIGQPYRGIPWNYAGTEGDTVKTYLTTVVDWVLVSLRSRATSTTSVWRRAGLLHQNGQITFTEPCFDLPLGSYFIVIEHRNHLSIMSPIAVSIVEGAINYDFTLSESYIVTDPPSFGSKLLPDGKRAMYSGDGVKTPLSNFDINSLDAQLKNIESGLFDQYRAGDFNLDADINSKDQILWKSNSGRYSGIPH